MNPKLNRFVRLDPHVPLSRRLQYKLKKPEILQLSLVDESFRPSVPVLPSLLERRAPLLHGQSNKQVALQLLRQPQESGSNAVGTILPATRTYPCS